MLTKWDALLVNAVGACLVEAVYHAEERARDFEMIAAALPHVSLGTPRMARLAQHAEALMAARGKGRAWSDARHRAETALADLLRWRAAELYTQLIGGDS